MVLSAGSRLGSYEILSLIGAGGMGEVYKAQDTKLGREVAVKVLPEAFARDKERFARFEREARLLASLNHPNIATIHGIEESDGVHFLVLELVQGETLAEQIKRGPVTIDEALPLFKQIADALEAAHEQGIIHRDLKPANIKVTPEGKVKVLDFGLAKALVAEEPAADSSQSPTLTKDTALGAIMGTAAYMSPEQARGKHVDRRTDIWAFGCCLYEALSGRKAFVGETVTDTIAAVINIEPDWKALPQNTPQRVRDLLRRCLQKDPIRRLRDAGDAGLEIEEAATEPAEAAVGRPSRARWLRPATWVLTVLMAAVAGALFWRRPVEPRQVTRSTILLDDPVAVSTGRPAVALSPDGTRLVVAVEREGITQLDLRRMDESAPSPIAGTEGASNPFFSSDGDSVGFVTMNYLKRVSLLGGAAESIIRITPVTRGVSWGPEDTYIVNYTFDEGLTKVTGGSWRDFTEGAGTKGSHRWPEFLPDGDTVLFTADKGGSFEESSIAAVSVKTGEQQILIEGGTNPRYASSGHIVFARGGALFAAPFDAARLEVTGESVRVLDGVVIDPRTGAAHFALSDAGSLVYVEGDAWTRRHVVVRVNHQGDVESLLTEDRPVMNPSLSPDGKHLAMAIYERSNSDIWVYSIPRGTLTRLTFDPGEDFNPIWSPDGQRIAFASKMTGGGLTLHWMPVDGSAAPELLETGNRGGWEIPQAWSPDGEVIAYQKASSEKGSNNIWFLHLTGEREAHPFAATEFNENGTRFSPNGRWIAYHSDESGRPEVYVQPFPGPGGKQQVSTDGGAWPVWMPDGGAICYRRGNTLMSVEIEGDTKLVLGKPRLLFSGRFTYGIDNHPNYSTTPDGKAFILVALEEREPPRHLNLIVNWYEELKRLVPTKPY